MPLPLAAAGAAYSLAVKAKSAIRRKKGGRAAPATGRRRRRKARLTAGDFHELSMIKNVLGKTAAANALPFYLGRGRG